jgi:histone chaperone ASF1
MSLVKINKVNILNNPAKFTDDLELEVTFDVVENLEDDLEWKLIYVASGTNEAYDQILDTVSVGPVEAGLNQFSLKCAAPDPSKILNEDIIGPSALLLVCSYKGQKFVQVGYYLNNEYVDENLKFNPPANPVIESIERNIAVDQPRVTTYQIDWK